MRGMIRACTILANNERSGGEFLSGIFKTTIPSQVSRSPMSSSGLHLGIKLAATPGFRLIARLRAFRISGIFNGSTI